MARWVICRVSGTAGPGEFSNGIFGWLRLTMAITFSMTVFASSANSLRSSGYASGTNSGIGFHYSGTAGLRIESEAIQYGASVDLTDNTTYLIVGRIDFQSGNDDVRLWLNPTPGSTAPADVDAYVTQSIALQATLGNGVAALWGGAGTGIVDEIRLGTDFADVAVPEPSTIAAFLGACALLMAYLRRK